MTETLPTTGCALPEPFNALGQVAYESCIFVAWAQHAGKVGELVLELEAQLPDPPCEICPRRLALEPDRAVPDLQVRGRPCLLGD